jgi:hypothetical protein
MPRAETVYVGQLSDPPPGLHFVAGQVGALEDAVNDEVLVRLADVDVTVEVRVDVVVALELELELVSDVGSQLVD